MQKTLYIIAGPNGAGKTTASYGLLPSLWNCKEFVNADEIARGLSPFNPEEMAFAAGRIQLERIEYLLNSGETFAIETTLSTKSYKGVIEKAKHSGYIVELLFLFLPSSSDAVDRVRLRVENGGHNIPENIIHRRYKRGLYNLFQIYMPLVDYWTIANNLCTSPEIIAKKDKEISIYQHTVFNTLFELYG